MFNNANKSSYSNYANNFNNNMKNVKKSINNYGYKKETKLKNLNYINGNFYSNNNFLNINFNNYINDNYIYSNRHEDKKILILNSIQIVIIKKEKNHILKIN